MRAALRLALALLVLAVIVLIIAIVMHRVSVRAFERRVEQAVVTTLQRETPQQFLVTGRLDVVSTVTVTSTRIFLPDILGLQLGRAEARVRVPGRVLYGFDVSSLTEDDVQILEDGLVEVQIPPVRIYAIDPDLAELEIESSSGWFQPEGGEARVTEEALGRLREGLERQGQAHLRDSVQPQVNTERAVRALLEPALRAAGVADPRIRVMSGGREISAPSG